MIRDILSKSINPMTENFSNLRRILSHRTNQAWLVRLHMWKRTNTVSHRFHFSNFRYYFTLFSKFFASFPHGTCSLSVSHQYLALDGIYHPIRAAIPSNSTRRRQVVHRKNKHERGYHPPWRSIQEDFACSVSWHYLSRLHFRRLKVWAHPASLAVTEGILVSFFSSA